MKTITVLKKTLDMFADPDHWGQGDWNGVKGRKICYCIMGGLRKSAFSVHSELFEHHNHPSFSAARDRIISTLNVADENEVWDWNDDKARTIGQIRQALRKAIRAEEKAAA